jgi:HEAT repeat protein
MWLFPSAPGYDLQAAIAAWTTVVAGLATVVLFAYTLALRFATVSAAHRRGAVVARWRRIFAAAALSATEARECALPHCTRAQRTDVLEEWNRARASVEGDAVANLIALAERLKLKLHAQGLLRRRKLSSRLLGVQTLGHCADRSSWSAIVALLDHPNTALSMTSAAALANIDPKEAMPLVMPHVIRRADWPATTVARVLKTIGPALVTQSICNAILTGDAPTAVRLLRYSELIRGQALDQLIELLLREREEPAVLSAAMKAAGSRGGVPRMSALAAHDAWYVRMQAARLLGRVGDEHDLPMLESLLSDREWWVRYRAAQAIVALPFLGPSALKALLGRQRDPFAADMLYQAMAEAGLA